MSLFIPRKSLAALAAEGATFEVNLDDEALATVADLVLRLHQGEALRARAVLPPAMLRSYSERGEVERAGMRSACKHVLMALVLLDIVDRPGAGG